MQVADTSIRGVSIARHLEWLLALTLLVAAVALVGCGDSTSEDSGEETDAASEGASASDEGDVVDADDGSSADFTLVVPPELGDGPIPVKYANFGVDGGENVSIPMEWQDPPDGTESYALVFVDRHPIASEWIHWMAVAIPPDATGVAEGASGVAMPEGTMELDNTWGETGYGGPEPPAGSGDHDYELIVYALDVESLDLPQQNTFAQFTSAIEGNVLDETGWTGTFGR
jgi:hypothetical protein